MKKNTILILGLLSFFNFQIAYAQTSDYLKSETNTGSGITTDNSQDWTNLFSITIDLGSNIADTKYVLVTASINMRPDGASTAAREANYNIYRSDDATDESGIIKRQIKYNTEAGVESWGIGTLVHIFDVSGLSGSKTYTLEHSNKGGVGAGRNVYSTARLTAVALSTATNHYELSNDVIRVGDAGSTTTSTTYTAVANLTTDAITLPIKGDIYVAASINGKATINIETVAEYKLEYSSDGGSNWADLGKPIKRSMINSWDDGIVSLVGLLQDQDADNDYKFRVAHKRVSGTGTVTTHNCNLVALALAHSNGGSFPAFYSEVGATGVDITGISASAATVTSTTFTAATDISSTGSNLFVNSQYLVSASGLNESASPQQRMRAGNQLYVNDGTTTVSAEEYYRYIVDNSNFGAGGFIGLMENLENEGSYTIGMKHQIAYVSNPDATENEILNTSNVILTGFQTYDRYFTWNGSSSTDFNTAANWSNNIIPSSGANVFFADNPDRSCYLDANRTIGALVINQSTDKLVVNGHDLTINGALTLSNGGQIDATTSSSTVILGSTSSQSIPDGAFYNNEVFNLTVNNSNNIQLSGTLRLLNTISASSGRLDVTTNSSTFVYAGTSAQTIESSILLNEKFYNLTIDNSTGVTLNADFTIDNDLAINSGKLFTLSAAKNLEVVGAITNSAGNSGFILNSDATGTASLIHSTNSVAATVKRYVSGNAEDWHFLSAPVSDQEISGDWLPSGTYGNNTGYDLYLWNESSSCWIYKLNTTSTINWNTVHSGSDFEVGRGYLYSLQESLPTKEFVGNLNNGNQSISLTYSSLVDSVKGFNLIGNPYPSSIDWKASSGWTRTNLASSGGGYNMWIWNPDANNYGVYNSADIDDTGTNSASRYIAPAQGFFVQADNTGNLSMSNSVRVSEGANNWFKSVLTDINRLNVSINSDAGLGSDEVRLNFGCYENEKGALKLFSQVSNAPSLYIPYFSDNLSVLNLTNTDENAIVPISFIAGTSGDYTIVCNFDSDRFDIVMLEDCKTHYIQNMKAKQTYNFSAEKSDSKNRFKLHFGASDGDFGKELPARIYSDGTHLIIDLSLVTNETTVTVCDIMGRILLQGNYIGETQHNIPLNIDSQIIIIHLKNSSGSIGKKIFLKKY
jgi:hypothetical protein